MSQSHTSLSFDVVPGRVYDLQLLLQRKGAEVTPTQTFVKCLFDNAAGQRMTPDFLLTVEVMKGGPLGDALTAAGLASRFIIVPAGAGRLTVSELEDSIQVLRCALRPLSIEWSNRPGQRNLETLTGLTESRCRLLDCLLPEGLAGHPWLKELIEAPLKQFTNLMSYFGRVGCWQPAISKLTDDSHTSYFYEQIERLSKQAKTSLPKVGFVGSARGRERLSGISRVVWLRSTDQLSLIDFDLIIIETAFDQWTSDKYVPLDFCSLNGDLPEAGAQLFKAAKIAGAPIHLWLTGDDSNAAFWRECAAKVDHVVAEGDGWDLISPDERVVQATEPAAFGGPSYANLMLVPVAVDMLRHEKMTHTLVTQSVHAPLITDFDFSFSINELQSIIKRSNVSVQRNPSRIAQRGFLQASELVLLFADSVRSDQVLAQIAIDAIAANAIPVMWGKPRGHVPLLETLDQVHTIADLICLQGLYRGDQARGDRLSALNVQIVENHVWTEVDRSALLGHDPINANFDRPKISLVMTTTKPELLTPVIAAFRQQSWLDTELVIVSCTDSLPADLPDLNDNERIFPVSKQLNSGLAFNLAIAEVTGDYWCVYNEKIIENLKYLRDIAYAYRMTQAEILGKIQSPSVEKKLVLGKNALSARRASKLRFLNGWDSEIEFNTPLNGDFRIEYAPLVLNLHSTVEKNMQ
ncbi:glycosyltransferase family 2 protein [Loktanella salsilacus]|uniref:glycosyltransferase family 2 protein n=1 Tax=Loktanella salsilacus TaxID=195913 RepID=UPI00373562DC